MSAPKRTVLITGASRGIGAACARRFARDRHDLALLARPSSELMALADELGALSVECDLADEAQIERALARVAEHRGPVDVLVNNAGIVHRHPVLGHATADWDRVMAVNLRAPFLLSRGVLPTMRERRHGRIINVGSISGTRGAPGSPELAAYSASKWGLIGLTRSLSEEGKRCGIVVTAVCPGSVDTDMLVGSGFTPDMTPADIAEIIAFLAAAPAAITGAAVEVFG